MTAGSADPRVVKRVARARRRFVFVNWGNVAHFAETMAAALGAEAFPRDPSVLLPRAGVEVVRVASPERAAWYRGGPRRRIEVADNLARGTAAYAIWRAWFGGLMHPPSLAGEPAAGLQLAPTEVKLARLSARFAAHVLMPEARVNEQAQRLRRNPEQMPEILAEWFGVSRAAMRRRLAELDLLPIRPPYSRRQEVR
jgi:hypothetical protein